MNRLRILSIIIAVLFAQVVVAQDVVKLPDEISEKTTCLNREFLLYRPKGVDASKKAPLLVYLHGRVWRGRNIKTIKRVGTWGLSANAAKQKLLLVMPQCDIDVRGGKKGIGRWNTDDLNLLLEYLKENHQIDEDRIYLAGYSMGGYGTWAWASACPKIFAAIAPIAGGGDPKKAGALKHLPIWVFHGEKDTTVPHKRSQDMVDALKSKGAKKVRFSSFPDQGHNRVLGLAIGNPELYKWLASHSRELAPGAASKPADSSKPKAETRPKPKPTSRPKRTDEERARSRLGLAKSYIAAGLTDKAVDALKKLVAKYPKTQAAKTAAAELKKLKER